MSKLEKLEQQVQSLSAEELTQFRAWFQKFDWAVWDARITADARAGKLDPLADEALHDHCEFEFGINPRMPPNTPMQRTGSAGR